MATKKAPRKAKVTESTKAISPGPHLKLVWRADNPDAEAPAVLEPGSPPHMVAFHRGYMRMAAGQYDQARIAYRKALEHQPEFVEALYGLALIDLKAENYRDAVFGFSKIVQSMPEFVEAHFCLGNALMSLEQNDQAVLTFEQVSKLKPEFAPGYFFLSMALSRIGRATEAQEALLKGATLDPQLFFEFMFVMTAASRKNQGSTISLSLDFPAKIENNIVIENNDTIAKTESMAKNSALKSDLEIVLVKHTDLPPEKLDEIARYFCAYVESASKLTSEKPPDLVRVFKNIPPELHTRPQSGSVKMPRETILQAKRILNTYERRKKQGVQLSAEAIEIARQARRLVRSDQRRRKAADTTAEP